MVSGFERFSFRFGQIKKALKLLALFPALSCLPPSAAYRIASLIPPMDDKALKSYLAGMRTGLARCLGDKIGNGDVLEDFLKRHVNMLAMEALDSYIIPKQTGKTIGRISVLHGKTHLDKALSQGKGVIIVTAHYGRLNMLAYTLGLMGQNTGILTQNIGKDNPLLDWVDRKYLQKKLKSYYQVTKGTGITLGDNQRKIFRALGRNEAMVILMDAYHPDFRNMREHPFLGGTIKLPTGIERISERTRSPLVYGIVKGGQGWRVRAELRPIDGYGKEAFDRAVEELEKDVRERPWDWWQWGYMNSMWKRH